VIFCLQGCDGWGEGRGILYIKASVVQVKDIRPWQLYLFNFAGFSLYISSEGSAKLRWVDRVAHLGEAWLSRVQLSTKGCSIAQKGAA
jgi:hypothetical protein